MKISLYYDTRRANKLGEYPIKVAINNGKERILLATGISILPKHWSGKNPLEPVRNTYADADRVNRILFGIVNKYHDLLLSCTENISVKMLLESVKHKEEYADKVITFTSFFNDYISTKNAGTQGLYVCTFNKIMSFTNNKDLMFDEMNFKWLTEFNRWLGDNGCAINTRAIHLRNIRSLFNQAICQEVIDYSVYPFKKFKIETTTKEKEYLTKDIFHRLCSYQPATHKEQVAKDMWLLSFYLCGINPIDLWNLKPAIDGVVSFQRQKIKFREPYHIKLKLTEKTKEILSRYDTSDCWLIDLCKYAYYKSFYWNLKHAVSDIGKAIGYPQLTMYHARYTFATYAHELGFSDSVIGHALGHSETTTTSKFYITFDWSQVWNMQVKLCTL